MSTSDKRSARRASMAVAAAQVRDEVRFMLRRMVLPIGAHELSVKAQHNKLARITGIPPRRIKDLWHSYANTIPAHQDRTIRAAYHQWLEAARSRARADLESIEAENDRLQKSAADYASARFARVCADASETRAVGGETTTAANDG